MRIGQGQLRRLIRAGVLLSACLMLWAATSGLLLAIHVHTAEHSADHDSHHCTICQQLLVVSKKPALAPSAELVHNTAFLCTDTPEFIEHIEARYPEISRTRGPPCSPQYKAV